MPSARERSGLCEVTAVGNLHTSWDVNESFLLSPTLPDKPFNRLARYIAHLTTISAGTGNNGFVDLRGQPDVDARRCTVSCTERGTAHPWSRADLVEVIPLFRLYGKGVKSGLVKNSPRLGFEGFVFHL